MKWGAAVIKAGMDDWEVTEVIGLLVDAKARVGTSSTQRLGMKRLGQMHLGIVPPLAEDAPPPTIH